jgi:hypothetical protein
MGTSNPGDAENATRFFSADEGPDVGQDGETPVTDDYKEGDNKFTGKIQKVVIDVGPVKLAAADREELQKNGPSAE